MKATQRDFAAAAPKAVRQCGVFFFCGQDEAGASAAADKIVAEAKARNVGQLVLGYPKNMDGSLGPRAEKSEELKALLEARCALPVVLWDERRTSIAAHDILHANGKKMKDHRKSVDAVAASLILEGYLGTLR